MFYTILNQCYFLLNALSPILGGDSGTGAAPPASGDAASGAASQTPPPETGGGLFDSMWVFGIWAVVLVGMYFLMMRPQRKREKKMKEMQAAIKTGDNIVTSGGFFGRVADVGQDCFIIEFGTNRGIRVPVLKSDVVGIRDPKTTPPPKEAIEKKE